jgi:hypothetical protein
VPLGIDDDGRERLEFIDGDVPVPPYPAWAQTDAALESVAVLLRRVPRRLVVVRRFRARVERRVGRSAGRSPRSGRIHQMTADQKRPLAWSIERCALVLMVIVAFTMSARALYEVGVGAGLGPVLAAGVPLLLDGFAILAARVVTRLDSVFCGGSRPTPRCVATQPSPI